MKLLKHIKSIALGYSEVFYKGEKYGVTREDFNGGKSIKVYAKALGGSHFISFNYYLTSTSQLLKPCEMPAEEVIHFLKYYKSI